MGKRKQGFSKIPLCGICSKTLCDYEGLTIKHGGNCKKVSENLSLIKGIYAHPIDEDYISISFDSKMYDVDDIMDILYEVDSVISPEYLAELEAQGMLKVFDEYGFDENGVPQTNFIIKRQ